MLRPTTRDAIAAAVGVLAFPTGYALAHLLYPILNRHQERP